MRVIIAGSRGFNDYALLKRKVDRILEGHTDITIISGTAGRGADRLGERYAEEKGYPLERWPADWKTFGRSAGYRRNAEMAKIADACIIFWDGSSPGSKHMYDLAKAKGLQVRLIIAA